MKLGELAGKLGLELRGDDEIEITGPAPIEAAGPGSITFASSQKYAPMLADLRASCAILPIELARSFAGAALISSNPYADFARTLAIFFPPYRPADGIDSRATVAADAVIGDAVFIGPFSYVGAGARIGRGSVIHPSVTIYPGAQVGEQTTIHSGASIRENVTIGSRVLIHNGAVIGADGFGFIEHGGELVKIPQVGRVVIEDDVEIGANSTVDRAMIGTTIVRRGAKLDNLVHIAHNCEVGECSRLAGQAGLAGSVTVGKWCEFGGQAGSADHVTIGDRARIVAQAGIHRNVSEGAIVGGTPAIDMRVFRRMVAVEPRLPELARRLRALEQKFESGDS
ncbi:MAG TPA: UDP-3-O-(3-hydroxymyristoyl)glucosamine N-acyltransferase [Candidatus Binataceae bacterium]|jgi:UDP-3-O-[3-hydroxymyristoyl] glucosamine N-acyltransferase